MEAVLAGGLKAAGRTMSMEELRGWFDKCMAEGREGEKSRLLTMDKRTKDMNGKECDQDLVRKFESGIKS
jgi:hypothetical protein